MAGEDGEGALPIRRFAQYCRWERSIAAAALRVRRLISSAVKLLDVCEE